MLLHSSICAVVSILIIVIDHSSFSVLGERLIVEQKRYTFTTTVMLKVLILMDEGSVESADHICILAHNMAKILVTYNCQRLFQPSTNVVKLFMRK